MLRNDSQPEDAPASPSRRRAMKAGAAIAVGAAVWTEPTIKGLARRPAYAATGSGAPISFDFSDDEFIKGESVTSTAVVGGVTYSITITRQSAPNDQDYVFTSSPTGLQLNGGTLALDGVTFTFAGETTPFTIFDFGPNANKPTLSGTLDCV